jgi:hypothetical protein
MEKGKTPFRWIGTIAVLISILFAASGICGETKKPALALDPRADMVTIDKMAAFGALERPAVVFLHDRHTEAVKKMGKDCTACHLSENKRLVPIYKRVKDTDKQTTMDIYHNNCIACHKDNAVDGRRGPQECAECHLETAKTVSIRQPAGMDKFLHYRHAKSQEKGQKCATCHHAYDDKAKKLFYDEGKEGSCRYCHEAKTVENRVAMRQASHLACIDCHRKTIEQKKDAGPIQCAGCHDPKAQAGLDRGMQLPRMKRNQPDNVFVKAIAAQADAKNVKLGMNAVAFSHKNHEGYNNSCRVCHHASLSACSDCHTVDGKKEGNFVNLGQSMHQIQNEASCVGCHTQKQSAPECAGCHTAAISKSSLKEASCLSCHTKGAPTDAAAIMTKASQTMAAEILKARSAVVGTYAVADIPEEVIIKAMSKTYEPVKFPHRKVVQKLIANIADNQLARSFHRDKGTLCMGCHHNSPAAKNPPRCGSCHGKPFEAKNMSKPGLMGAYHQQCLGCHDAMGIVKPNNRDCTGCHIEKKQW